MDLTSMLGGSKEKEKGQKATDLLEDDHNKVKALFRQYRDAKENGDGRTKRRLFADIDRELSIHSMVEEEIFYPAVRKSAGDAKDIVLESREEHGVVKTLLSQLRDLGGGDETFDAKMKVLMEAVEHHADEEEDEMFPKAEELGDERLQRLGTEMTARKEQLMQSSPAALAEASSRSSSRGSSSRGSRSSSRSSRGRKSAAQRSSGAKTGAKAKGSSRSASSRGKAARAKSAATRASSSRSRSKRSSSRKSGARSGSSSRTTTSR